MRATIALTVPLLALAGSPALPAAHLAAQAQDSARPPALTVRLGERTRTVPAVAHPAGGVALRADVLAEALGGQLVPTGAGSARYRFEVGRTGIDIEHGSTLAVVVDDTVPLAADVFRHGGAVYVPMAMATELLPRLGAGVMFDVDKRELRRFAPSVASARSTPARPPAANTAAKTAPVPGGTAAARRPVAASPTDLPGSRQRVVVVDAGHGGPDRGMSGPLLGDARVYEKNITLAVSKQLERALQQRGIRVVMTRTTDTLIALSDRGRIANDAKGDLFVSIHVNAANPRWANPGGARGYETYFLAEAKTEDERRVAAMENEAVRFETRADVSGDDPLGFLLRDMAQNEHLRESLRLADLIQGGMRAVHPGPNRGVKQAGFRVLVTAFMPAVLVEIGFGTNRDEAAYMTSPDKQAELAETIADAVARYLAEYERKVSG